MKKRNALAIALLALTLSGSAYAAGLSADIVISTPPPPPRQEVMTVPPPGPPAQWVWHKGHWRLIDSIQVWVPGHWVARPTPTAVWVEPHWVERGGGWVFVEGHWR